MKRLTFYTLTSFWILAKCFLLRGREREREGARGREGIAKSLSMINDRLEKHSQHQQHAEPFPIFPIPFPIFNFSLALTHSVSLAIRMFIFMLMHLACVCVCVCRQCLLDI